MIKMKLKDGFVIHNSDGEQIMVAVGEMAKEFSGLVRSNKTAAFIVECLKEDTTKEKIVDAMLEKYEVSRDVVEKDVEDILGKLRNVGAIDE